jgi:membrane-associated phospholipid phosphatase
MNALHHYELSLMPSVQHGGCSDLMIWISRLGWEALWFVLPFVYLCVNRRVGARLMVLYFVNLVVVNLAKLAFQWPRPNWAGDMITNASNYGMPSGHAQLATVVWIGLASEVNRPWMWVLSSVVVLAVGLSRVYLGLHYPSDVLGGCILGATLLAASLKAELHLLRCLRKQPLSRQLWGFLALAAAVFLVGALAERSPDLGWVCQAAGGLLGTTFALAMADEFGLSEQGAPMSARLISFVYFMSVTALLWNGLAWGALGKPQSIQNLAAFVRDCSCSWLIGFAAPWSLRWLAGTGSWAGHRGHGQNPPHPPIRAPSPIGWERDGVRALPTLAGHKSHQRPPLTADRAS